jgi:hypothetical protein
MHLHMSHEDIKNLPIQYRRWLIKRLSRHFEQKKAVYDSSSNSNSSSGERIEKFDINKVDKFFSSKFKK